MTHETSSDWREILALTKHLGRFRWAPPVMVLLGIGAAFAEMLGIAVAVMFLFALLDQGQSLRHGDGFVASGFRLVEDTVGGGPMLLPLVLVAIILFNSLLLYLYEVTTATVLQRIAQRMRDKVHHRYVTVSYKHLQSREPGELLHTLSNETWTAAEAVQSVARMTISLCTGVVFGIGIFLLSWQMGLAAFVAGAALLLVTGLLAAPARRYGEQTLAANQVLAERMLVSLNGMRTIRAFAQEPYVLRVFGSASAKVRRLATRTEWLKALVHPITEVGAICALLGVVLVATTTGVETATTVAAGLLLFRLIPRLREIQNESIALSNLTASMRDVRQVLDAVGHREPPAGDRQCDTLCREIRFEEVGFTHLGRAEPALERTSFSIQCGQVTALVGPSGSGKTTVVNLLLRLYQPTSGCIRVDNIDLQELDREGWLDRLSVAGQDIDMLEGTIAQNFRIARRDVSVEDMRKACAVVEMLEDIDSLPDGFDTRIGAFGLAFSGGQRQRLGLARALLRNPDILILDEALSAVEAAMEDRIRERILDIMRGRTIVSISHRRDGADWADAIVRFEKGRVVRVQHGRAPQARAV